jgi:hypothetical protein
MSWLKNMGIAFRTGRGHPASRADLYAYCEGMIKRPPVAAEWKARFDSTMFNVKGVPHTTPTTTANNYSNQLSTRLLPLQLLPCSVLSASTKLCRISRGETCITAWLRPRPTLVGL